ncbi:hypothetical protein EJD96_21980 [Herbaspirillum seropedicae]|uniref:hypothetical protein n=1 Tax=Herbaspirillum seropedicae TaxID=964 RepID=UPI00112194F0|nr:hypothetical protein [Herbaspirillum seropedicae]QDD66643.1 hypothetical protein EJD96_21980 [Herbaspirillum seropedicae]
MIDTKIDDEQDITSYLVQQLYFSQQRSIRHFFEELSSAGELFFSLHQSDLRRLSLIKALDLPDAQAIVENHTRYRYYELGMDSRQKAILREHYLGKPILQLHTKTGMVDKVRSIHGICVTCVSSDLMTKRFPITRRIFLVPGIVVCPTHNQPLLSFCRKCAVSRRRHTHPEYVVPSLKCPCGNELEEIVHLDQRGHAAAVWIAGTCQQILQGLDVDDFTPQKVRSAVRTSTIFSRHLKGPTPLAQIMHTFDQAIGPILGRHLQLTESMMKRLIRKGGPPVKCTVQLLATIFAVFGDMQAYKNALTLGTAHIRFRFDFVVNTQGMPYQDEKMQKLRDKKYKSISPNSVFTAQIKSLTADQKEELRTESRLWLAALKQKKPGLTFNTFRVGTGRSRWYRFLTIFDETWLREQFPGCRSHQEMMSVTAEEISSMKAEAKRIANETSKSRPFRRITRSHIRGKTTEQRFSSAMNMDVDFRKTVLRLVDTDEKWRKRLTRVICHRVSKIDANSRWGKRDTYDGLEFRDFKRLIQSAADWLRKKESRITS